MNKKEVKTNYRNTNQENIPLFIYNDSDERSYFRIYEITIEAPEDTNLPGYLLKNDNTGCNRLNPREKTSLLLKNCFSNANTEKNNYIISIKYEYDNNVKLIIGM